MQYKRLTEDSFEVVFLFLPEVETEVMGWMDKATFSCGPGGVIEISDAYYGGTYKTDCISKTVQSSVEYL